MVIATIVSCKADPVIYRVNENETKDKGNTEIPEGAGNSLKVSSFNIRYYNETDPYPWSARKDAVMKYVKDNGFDFVGMQELRSQQAQDIIYNLGDDYGFYDINRDTGSSIGSSNGEGVGILYRKDRFNILDKGFFWLAENPDKLPDVNADGTYSSWHSACRRVTLWVKAEDRYHNGETVWFFATHFDHVSSTARLNSSNLTIKKMCELTGVSELKSSKVPVFLVGDLNCEYGSAELAPIRSEMKDARTMSKETDNTRTSNGYKESGGLIIDYIFFDGKITADKYHVATEDYGVKFISDHYPVYFICSYK